MLGVLQSKGYKVAMGDVFPNDVLFQDVSYLRHGVERCVRPGRWVAFTVLLSLSLRHWLARLLNRLCSRCSIIILHSPSKCFRENNLEEARCVLEVLRSKGLHAVTLSTLYNHCADKDKK